MCKVYNNVVMLLKFEIKTLLFFSKVTHNLNTRTQEAEAVNFCDYEVSLRTLLSVFHAN